LKKTLNIRPADKGDRAAVEAISAQIWDGDDYVSEVWDEWLADPHGQFAVAEMEGRVVAFAKLTRFAEDEWWMEGMRVDPAYRQRGIGSQLHHYLLEEARRMGRGTVRLGTAADNDGVHRMAQGERFHHIATYERFKALVAPMDVASPLLRFDEPDLPAVWALVQESARYRASRGMYELWWHWKNLTYSRFRDHLAAGEVWGIESAGHVTALSIICQEEEADLLHVCYVDGTDAALPTLARGLRGLAGRLGCSAGVRFKAISEPTLIGAIEDAGYERAGEDLWIFERRLDEGESE